VGKPAYCVSHGDLNFSQVRADGTGTLSSINSHAKVFGNFFQQSSFATHALASERNVVKIDRDLPLPLMAPLGCAVQTGAGAVLNSFGARPGSSLVVFGCGGVGLSAVLAGRIAGCARVIAVDINPERLRIAAELGATHTVVSSPDVVASILLATKGQGVNFALDTSGKKESLLAGVAVLSPMGVCGFVAPGQVVEIPTMNLLAGKQFRGVIQGDAVPQVFIPQLIQFWRDGKLPFDRFVTMYKGLTEINQAVEDMKTGKTIKPVLCLS
jgi:aryl-alcohol dehydrogenase